MSHKNNNLQKDYSSVTYLRFQKETKHLFFFGGLFMFNKTGRPSVVSDSKFLYNFMLTEFLYFRIEIFETTLLTFHYFLSFVMILGKDTLRRVTVHPGIPYRLRLLEHTKYNQTR